MSEWGRARNQAWLVQHDRTPGRKVSPRPMSPHRAVSPRPRWVLDRPVAAFLILGWLLMAAGDTYAPLVVCVLLWIVQAWGLRWLWRQYLEHTAPSPLDPPRPVVRADIPLVVRLCLLPGAWRLVGHSNVSKARAIRFMRRDRAERARAAVTGHRPPTAEELEDWRDAKLRALQADQLTGPVLDILTGTTCPGTGPDPAMHRWNPGKTWCCCGHHIRASVTDPDSPTTYGLGMVKLADTYGLRDRPPE
jgi:hypothetical protein